MNRFVVLSLSAVFLAVFLATSGCASNRGLAEQQSELDRLRIENESLQTDLSSAFELLELTRSEYQSSQARVAELERALSLQSGRSGERGETVAILPTDIFFESGSALLTPEGIAGLVEVAARLHSEFSGQTIRVEGYTDTNPIGENLQVQYPSNWELSAARAAMVARHLQWTHEFDGGNMEVVGLSQYHPMATNDTAEGREQNRRVRIAVMAD
ncbi:MAG: OmpA family protein [Bacteroidetes bacterium]|nr:OmpA family protein [Bacteroidota bacterium]